MDKADLIVKAVQTVQDCDSSDLKDHLLTPDGEPTPYLFEAVQKMRERIERVNKDTGRPDDQVKYDREILSDINALKRRVRFLDYLTDMAQWGVDDPIDHREFFARGDPTICRRYNKLKARRLEPGVTTDDDAVIQSINRACRITVSYPDGSIVRDIKPHSLFRM